LPYGIHALLRQWSGLLQVRLGTLAAQLTMDAFPLDAIAASSDSTEDRACIADMWALLEPEAQAAARPATDGGHSVGPTQPLAGVPPPPLSLPNLATERIHQLWPLPSDELTTSRSIDVADSQHSAGGGPSVTFDPGGGGSAARSAQPVRLSPPVTLLRRKGEFVRAVCANSLNSSQLAVALTKGVYQLELVSDVDHAKMPGAIHDGPVLHTKLAHSLHSGASHTGSLVGGQLAAWGIGLRKATSPYATLVGTPKGGGSAATQLTVHWQSLGSNLVTRCLYSHPKLPLYLAGGDGIVQCWQFGQTLQGLGLHDHLRARYALAKPFTGSSSTACASNVRISPCSEQFACIDDKGRLGLWRLQGGRADDNSAVSPFTSLQCYAGSGSDVCYVDSSVVLATAGHGGSAKANSICLWDVLLPPTQAQVAGCAPHPEGGTCVAYAPSERAIVSGGARGNIAIFDLRQRRIRAQWTAHTLAVRSLSVDDAGFTAFTASADGDLKMWTLTGGCDEPLGHLSRLHEPHTVSPLFHPAGTALGRTYGVTCMINDGTRLVTGGADGRVTCVCY